VIPNGEVHVFLRGGLGNQLFQYATGLSYSIAHGKQLVIRPDLLPPSQDDIEGISRWPNQISNFAHSGELRQTRLQPPYATNLFGKSMQLMRMLGDLAPHLTQKLGWLAGENSVTFPATSTGIRLINSYAMNKMMAWGLREHLVAEIRSIVNPSRRFETLKSEMLSTEPIVVHLRQGDYLNLKETYGELTSSYFSRAFEILRNVGHSRPVWLFTDGSQVLPSQLEKAINANKVIGPSELLSPLETLCLMGYGRSFIASNSSFSWWAAFLQNPGQTSIVPHISEARVHNFSRGSEPDKTLVFLDV
jgi:hypothetical protein